VLWGEIHITYIEYPPKLVGTVGKKIKKWSGVDGKRMDMLRIS